MWTNERCGKLVGRKMPYGILVNARGCIDNVDNVNTVKYMYFSMYLIHHVYINLHILSYTAFIYIYMLV